jgi:leucine dehydrogenase
VTTAAFLELIEAWDGLAVVVRHDRPTGTWIFVALHDDTLGPPTGGCRMKPYDRPEEGLRDALRLAEGMTHKWAAMDFPFGGGKSVLAVPRPLEGEARRGLLRRFGHLLNSLGGAYGTGEDLGTTPEDMMEIASVSKHVIGLHGRSEGPMDPGPFTALGVFEGIRAAMRHRVASDDLSGRSVLVQGVGDVGEPLARMVAAAGGSLLLADLDEERARELADELRGVVVEPQDVYDARCDVYAPCAVGATLNADSIARLRCLVVAGSANNQLETIEDAERLHRRGIVYAPDFVVNGGGAMAFTSIYLGEDRVEELERRVRSIGTAIAEILHDSEERAESPLAAARRRVQRTLERGRASVRVS